MNQSMTNKRCYILGKMRGIPQFGFPLFDATAARLKAAGYEPVNPADIDRAGGFDPSTLPADWDWNILPPGLSKSEIIKRDLDAVQSCAFYVALPNHTEGSEGAFAEKAVLDWMHAQRLDFVTLAPVSADGKPCGPAVKQGDSSETRMTDPATGGQKGVKLERFDLIPPEPLEELAATYGRGSMKYEDHNWSKGYKWGYSFGAMMRHAWKFWRGEQRDELGNHHLACVAWHCFTLMWFERYRKEQDDRLAVGVLQNSQK
jgi:hypothetical protein